MKSLHKPILLVALAFLVTSCFDKRKPNYQYFADTDMYETPAYKTMGEYEIFPNKQSVMEPAENSISRGTEIYPFANDRDGQKAAIDSLKNPLPFTEANVEKGKELYDIYCAICHGPQGDGQGTLAEREKMMGIPGFDDENRDMSEGNIYHIAYYGLNNMGSYATQTTTKERWQIIHYISTLQDKLNGDDEREFVEDTLENSQNFDKEITPLHQERSVALKNKN